MATPSEKRIGRRTLLRTLGATAVAGGLSSSAIAADGSESTVGESLRGKRVYVDSRLNLSLPAGTQVKSLESDPDVVLLPTKTLSRRKKTLELLQRGVAVAFIGYDADAALAGLFTNEPPSKIRTLSKKDKLTDSEDTDFRWTATYTKDEATHVAVAYPRSDEIVDTHLYDLNPNPKEFSADRRGLHAFQSLDKTLSAYEGYSTLASNPNCPGDDDWNCLSSYHKEGSIDVTITDEKVYYEKWIRAAALEGENNNFLSTRSNMSITPHPDSGTNNDYIRNEVQFDEEMSAHGPETTPGSETTTISVGASVDQDGASVNAGWSWQSTSSNVRVTEDYYPTEDRDVHNWKIDPSSYAGRHTVQANPGYQCKAESYDTYIKQDFTTKFAWQSCGGGCVAIDKTLEGPEYWSF